MTISSKKAAKTLLLALTALSGLSVTAQAAPVTFDLAWSNIDNPSIFATGTVTLDDALNNASGWHDISLPDLSVSNLTITVTGSTDAANGIFTGADFTNLNFDSSQILDFSADLVGQAGFNDFNLVAAVGSNAPTYDQPLRMTSDNGNGHILFLVSMNPHAQTVPEPASVVLLSIGLAGFGVYRRRA